MTPYNEQAMQRAGAIVAQAYTDAGRDLDAEVIVWGGRIQADAPEMGYDASIAKHEPEWRRGLGLPPREEPVQPPEPHNDAHVTPGAPSLPLARAIVYATAAEFPQLTRVFSTDQAASNAMYELLLRTIWHLKIAGIPAARQLNPSGVLSIDKVAIQVPMGMAALPEWVCVDIATIGFTGKATVTTFTVLEGAHPVENYGLADDEQLLP